MRAPKTSELHQELHWERGWEEHKQLRFLRLARLPSSEKLFWLEQAHRIVLQLSSHHFSDAITQGDENSSADS